MLKGELFSHDMVRAYLEGRKLHTARPIKTQPPEDLQYPYGFITGSTDRRETGKFCWTHEEICDGRTHTVMPKHHPGDFMYCRETWAVSDVYGEGGAFGFDCSYKGGGIVRPCITRDFKRYCEWGKFFDRDGWIPSIHMPREAARLFFRISHVEAMRLDDVTEEFAREDGFTPHDGNSALVWFRVFWQATYGDAQWMWVYWTDPVTKEEALANAQ